MKRGAWLSPEELAEAGIAAVEVYCSHPNGPRDVGQLLLLQDGQLVVRAAGRGPVLLDHDAHRASLEPEPRRPSDDDVLVLACPKKDCRNHVKRTHGALRPVVRRLAELKIRRVELTALGRAASLTK